MTNHFFKTFAFEFETTRLLWYIPSGGADFGEVASTVEKIREGNHESWYLEWQRTASTLEKKAHTFKSTPNKANAYLRASRYYQAAEFFLPPSDKRKIDAYEKSKESGSSDLHCQNGSFYESNEYLFEWLNALNN